MGSAFPPYLSSAIFSPRILASFMSDIDDGQERKVPGTRCSVTDPCPSSMICEKRAYPVCRCRPLYGYIGETCAIPTVQTWIGLALSILNTILWAVVAVRAGRYLSLHYKLSVPTSGGGKNARGAVLLLWFFGGILGMAESTTLILIRGNFFDPSTNELLDNQIQGVIETLLGLCILLPSFILAATWLRVVASTQHLSQTSKVFLLKARRYISGASFIFAISYPGFSFSGQRALAAAVMALWACILVGVFYYGGSRLSNVLEELDTNLPPTKPVKRYSLTRVAPNDSSSSPNQRDSAASILPGAPLSLAHVSPSYHSSCGQLLSGAPSSLEHSRPSQLLVEAAIIPVITRPSSESILGDDTLSLANPSTSSTRPPSGPLRTESISLPARRSSGLSGIRLYSQQTRGRKMRAFTRSAASLLLLFIFLQIINVITMDRPVSGYFCMLGVELGFGCLIWFGWRNLEYTGSFLLNNDAVPKGSGS